MDSILKLVYPYRFLDYEGHPKFLLNGCHKAAVDYVLEKVRQDPTLTVEQVTDELRQENDHTWDSFFRHSNFLSYYKKFYNYSNIVDIDQIIDDGSVYIWVLEVGGSLDDVYNRKTLKVNNNSYGYTLIDTIPAPLLSHIKNGLVKIVINTIHDPIFSPITIMQIEDYFESHGIKAENVIIIGGNDYKNYYIENPAGKINLTYGYIMVEQAGDRLDNFPYFSSLGYMSDAVRPQDLNKDIIRPKRFLCWNRTMRSQRVWLAYLALKYKLLENSFFSFLNPSGGGINTIMQTLKQIYPEDADEFTPKIHDLIPYDLDTHHLSLDQKMGFATNNNKKEFYINSYVHITSETLFEHNPGSPFFSEKTFHAMVNLQPFIYVGNAKALEQLRDWGIKTFHPFIDESYDSVIDPKERFKLIEKEIVKLNNLSIEELHEWYYSITDILIHNQQILKQFKNSNPFEHSLNFIRNRYGH